MQVALFMFTADGQRRRFPLQRGCHRHRAAGGLRSTIPLTEVSRKHCRIVQDSQWHTLEDLGSSNGTSTTAAAFRRACPARRPYCRLGQ